MNTLLSTAGGYVAAMFSRDFVEADFDLDAVAEIHRGEFDEWTLAAARSGVLSNGEVAGVVESWQDNPKVLLDTLLVDADEVTRKRYESTWEALDRAAASDSAVSAVVESAPIFV